MRAQEAASGERLELLRADGGAIVNRWLMQFQADVLGVPVSVPEIAETTALGAAYLAGIATGIWTLPQVGEMWREADRYEPRMESARREELLADWSRAVGEVARMGEMKPQVYKDPRPAEYFQQFHAAARKGVGWTYTFARIILTLPTLLIWRVRQIGVENVPKDGPLVLAPNHFSQMDHFFVGVYLRRKIRFMAKSQLFGPPVLTYIYKHGGVFPIRRGHHDEEAIETARILVEQGEMLLIYAEGGRIALPAAGRAETGDRPDRAGNRGADRPGRDPGLRAGPPVEAVPLPEGHRPVRRAARLPGRGLAREGAPAGGRDRGLRPGAGDVRGAEREALATRSAARGRGRTPDRDPG